MVYLSNYFSSVRPTCYMPLLRGGGVCVAFGQFTLFAQPAGCHSYSCTPAPPTHAKTARLSHGVHLLVCDTKASTEGDPTHVAVTSDTPYTRYCLRRTV